LLRNHPGTRRARGLHTRKLWNSYADADSYSNHHGFSNGNGNGNGNDNGNGNGNGYINEFTITIRNADCYPGPADYTDAKGAANTGASPVSRSESKKIII